MRAAYAEVRPNGSSISASFEHTLPQGVFFDNAADGSSTFTIEGTTVATPGVDAPGTNQSSLGSLVLSPDTNSTDLDTVEAATARAIDSAELLTQFEDVIGIVRSFVGPDGFSSTADASLD